MMRKSLVGKAATQPFRLLIWDFKVHVEDCQTLGKLGQIWRKFQCPQPDSTLVVFLKRHENLIRNKGSLSHQQDGWSLFFSKLMRYPANMDMVFDVLNRLKSASPTSYDEEACSQLAKLPLISSRRTT